MRSRLILLISVSLFIISALLNFGTYRNFQTLRGESESLKRAQLIAEQRTAKELRIMKASNERVLYYAVAKDVKK